MTDTTNLRLGSIQNWPTDELKPFEKNAKLHPEEQVNALAASIKELGFRNKPIEITPDGTIVNGHGRWLACKKLGFAKVPVVILDDMSESEIRKYRITDNKIADTGFDSSLLKDEMVLLTMEGIDFSGVFSEKELDFLVGDLGTMDMDAITGDLADDVDELSQATQKSIDSENERVIQVSKVLGYSNVTESQQRSIARLQAHAEGVTGLQAGAALSAYAKEHAGL